MLPEEALVSAIAAAVGGPSGNVVLGIGDDAAVLDDGTVISTDILVEGVHFDLARTAPREVGHRAATANLSDLAAFGLPDGFAGAAEIAAGMREHGVPVAGGDLSRAPVLIVSVTALGRCERPVRRSGGRPGDVLVVTGPLGGQAAAGYTGRVLPRTGEGCALASVATAMIDLSDGIATDAARLARASGTGAIIELERLPRASGASIEQAATGGEDYELLAALPPDADPPVPVTVVGRLTDGADVVLLDAAGAPQSLRGWDHFG